MDSIRNSCDALRKSLEIGVHCHFQEMRSNKVLDGENVERLDQDKDSLASAEALQAMTDERRRNEVRKLITFMAEKGVKQA